MSAPPPLDPSAIERLRRLGGDDLVRRMIELFLEDAPKRIVAARRAVETDDMDGARRAAHSLKSAAGILGARELQTAAERVEEWAGGCDAAEVHGLPGELEALFTAARAELEAEQRRIAE